MAEVGVRMSDCRFSGRGPSVVEGKPDVFQRSHDLGSTCVGEEPRYVCRGEKVAALMVSECRYVAAGPKVEEMAGPDP